MVHDAEPGYWSSRLPKRAHTWCHDVYKGTCADLRVALQSQSEYFINKVIYFNHSPAKLETKNLETSSTLFLNLLCSTFCFSMDSLRFSLSLVQVWPHEHESPVRKLRLRMHRISVCLKMMNRRIFEHVAKTRRAEMHKCVSAWKCVS